jgi:hypothetical protein
MGRGRREAKTQFVTTNMLKKEDFDKVTFNKVNISRNQNETLMK